MLKIYSIELTNICNLRCSHCPSHGSKYPRGMMTAATFEKCLEYVDPDQSNIINRPIISGFGETLLHPDYDTLFGIAKRKGIYLRMHSNGLTLGKDEIEMLLDNNVTHLEVSLHTEKSVVAFALAYDIITQRDPNIHLRANVMECYLPKLQGWINTAKLPQEALHRITVDILHNWAMNEREYSDEENLKW